MPTRAFPCRHTPPNTHFCRHPSRVDPTLPYLSGSPDIDQHQSKLTLSWGEEGGKSKYQHNLRFLQMDLLDGYSRNKPCLWVPLQLWQRLIADSKASTSPCDRCRKGLNKTERKILPSARTAGKVNHYSQLGRRSAPQCVSLAITDCNNRKVHVIYTEESPGACGYDGGGCAIGKHRTSSTWSQIFHDQ